VARILQPNNDRKRISKLYFHSTAISDDYYSCGRLAEKNQAAVAGAGESGAGRAPGNRCSYSATALFMAARSMPQSTHLIEFRIGGLDDRRPAREVALDLGAELLGCVRTGSMPSLSSRSRNPAGG